MASNMANIGHTRSKSLRVPGGDGFLKRPAPVAASSTTHTKEGQHNGPSHLTLFLRNLRLLQLDLAEGWPDITTETFSTKDNQQNIKKRIQSVEWTLYQLFCLWDPKDAHEKLSPFFPPQEPLQSIKLRGALYTCLDHLKKNGILGRDAVLRKTMLDECKGERLEEVLSAFSTAVLKRLVQDDGGHEAIAQQLALEKFHYTSVPTEDLIVLVLTHQVSLRRILQRKQEASGHYNGFARVLREKDELLTRRKEEMEKAIEEDENTEFISRAETQALQDKVRKNWYGSNEWLGSVIHGDGPAEDGGLLSQPFDKVWKNVESGDLEEVEGRRRKGLLEQLDARVQEQNSRLEKWKSFGEQISVRSKGEKKEEKKEVKVPANLDLGLGAHEALQLNIAGKKEQKQWAPNKDNSNLLDRLKEDLANVGKPKRVENPAKRRVPTYEEPASRSPSPEPVMRMNNTPRKQEWANTGQNNTPRAQEWEFQASGRESVDLDGSRSPSPQLQQQHREIKDVDMDMDLKEPERQQQLEDEDSYDEISHEDAMDVDDKEEVQDKIPERVYPEQFMAPPAGSPLLRDSPAVSRMQNIDYSSMPPPRGPSLLRTSQSAYAAQSLDDLADMAPPPAASLLRASPSPYAAQNVEVKESMPPPPVPQKLRRSTPSKTDLQARLRSSARKPSAKKSPLPQPEAKEPVPESPNLATKILNSMDAVSPSPVKRHQPPSLADRTRQSMTQSSALKPRDPAPQIPDLDDDSLEQFTPRPPLSRRSSTTTTTAPSTITRSMTLADRTRLTMSSLRSSAQPPAMEQDSMDDLLSLTPRASTFTTTALTPVPMTLKERTMLSMSGIRPKSTIKKSRQSIANLEEYEELQFVASPQQQQQQSIGRNPKIRLSSVPFMDGMAEEDSDDFGAADEAARKSEDLVERTRQSMKDLEIITSKAQLDRKKSVKVAARKKRESFMPKRQEEDTSMLIERADEVDYEDAFRSRPKIAMSPGVSPNEGWREGSVSPLPM